MSDRPVITIDPAVAWGQPAIRGVGTEHIAGIVWAGETFETAADEYGLSRDQVILACWWEAQPGRPFRREWQAWAEAVHPLLKRGADLSGVLEPPAAGWGR